MNTMGEVNKKLELFGGKKSIYINTNGSDCEILYGDYIASNTVVNGFKICCRNEDYFYASCTSPIKKGDVILQEPVLLAFCGLGSSSVNSGQYGFILGSTMWYQYFKRDIMAFYPRKVIAEDYHTLQSLLKHNKKLGGNEILGALKCMRMMTSNAFERRDGGTKWACLYKNACFFNNGCNPNAYREFGSGLSINLIAERDIAVGEEITIGYDETLCDLPREERRKRIMEKFGFDCICLKCESGL